MEAWVYSEEATAIFTVRWIILIQLAGVCFAVLLHCLRYVVIIMQIAIAGIEDFRFSLVLEMSANFLKGRKPRKSNIVNRWIRDVFLLRRCGLALFPPRSRKSIHNVCYVPVFKLWWCCWLLLRGSKVNAPSLWKNIMHFLKKMPVFGQWQHIVWHLYISGALW